MRFAAAVAAFAGVAAASAWGPPSNGTWPETYVTETVTAFTTYCPEATKLTHNGVTYTVTSATTLTITNCPCTVTKPVSSSVGTAPVTTSKKPASTGVATGTAPHGTASGHYSSSSAKATATTSPITPSKGGASQLEAGAAAVLAVFGLVAAL